jgi:polyisoprenoid-binding protein YceI
MNMKRIYFILSIVIIGTTMLTAQQKLTADTEKTTLGWLGEKVTGQHNGSINLKDGWLEMKDNRLTGGSFSIDMTTIKDADGSDRLVGHLKSDDFFGVEKYPVSLLLITGSESFDNGTAIVKGNLTIKGVTNPVEFKATTMKKDNGTWFFANIVVDRTKYNIRYGSGSFIANLGDKVIYDEFKLKVSLLVR